MLVDTNLVTCVFVSVGYKQLVIPREKQLLLVMVHKRKFIKSKVFISLNVLFWIKIMVNIIYLFLFRGLLCIFFCLKQNCNIIFY